MEIRLRRPTVGPIVGFTTETSARIWARGEFESTQDGPRRCFGALRYRKVGGQYGKPHFLRMMPNFDLTGVLVLSGLTAGTAYEYEIGWFFHELEPETLDESWQYVWDDGARGSFRTTSKDAATPQTLVLGSCRYLLRLLGGNWFDSRGDKAFRSILEQIDGGKEIDLLLMMGDQIYADDMTTFRPDLTVDEYLKRYREVFGQEHIRELMSRVPTYMTLDDHEIEDNWPEKADPQDVMIKYPAAIHAYLCYQMSHSPLFEADGERITGTPEKLWYSFASGCCDFFVTDTRTERYLPEDDAEERQIISDLQMQALKDWLGDGADKVKLVVSAVPFFPDKKQLGADKWDGFPEQRSEILEFIRERKIRKVVFLSGDIHVSMTAELKTSADPDFKVISVISSPFFWPYPHPKGAPYQLEGDLRTRSETVYRLHRAGSPFHRTDNFTRMTVHPDRVRVETFARKGDRLGTKTHRF